MVEALCLYFYASVLIHRNYKNIQENDGFILTITLLNKSVKVMAGGCGGGKVGGGGGSNLFIITWKFIPTPEIYYPGYFLV